MSTGRKLSISALLVILGCDSFNLRAQNPQPSPAPIDASAFEGLVWRSIGPANMGGRTADIEGVAGNPNAVYVATASGGLWKTTNGGTTWKAVFERENTLSLGDIALDPQNPDVIWAGTGEANPRNSVSFGDGVYKSTDGGETWQHLGLKDTKHISRILVHPQDGNTAYVGALGHAFGPNEERGVFMTADGGKSWTKTLYIDAEHGIADMDIDPSNSNILYAAAWSFERKPWTFRSGSEKGGVFKSIDGGRTWKKLTLGLPKLMGRIGVKVAPSNPQVVYVIAEAKEGTLYRSDDRGESFRQVSKQANIVSRGFYYTDLRVDPSNEERVYAVASTLFLSIDGGKTFRSISGKTHVDYHALWIDPKNPSRMWQGQDGGVAVSYDRGETWEYVNNFPIGQFYHVYADNRSPFYYVMGGLQDNGSWTGPSQTREPAGILNDDWRMVSFGDGFTVVNHEEDPDLYLSESQGGNIVRTDFRTREQQLVRPYLGGGGAALESKYRFHWNAPLVKSPHDKNVVLLGGNVVFRSSDFGKTWQIISPDLTTNDPEKLKEAGGPVATENTTAEYHCTIISLAESPARAGTIWAGTDDGNVRLTQNGGKSWIDLTRNLPGLPSHSPVSHVEPSRAGAETAYVSFDRHMFDDVRPYVFKTSDSGRSWTNITGDLPEKAYVHVVREDLKNPSLLYVGTELGLYASYAGGNHWISLGLKNLPRVAVHDIVVHSRENDLILATHGRSIWIFDDATPIQQMTAEIAGLDMHLFDIPPALRMTTRFTRYGIGDKVFVGPNAPYGARITYHLKSKPEEKTTVKLEVYDSAEKMIREIAQLPKEKGLNRVSWDLRYDPPKLRRPPSEDETRFFGGPRGPQVIPGIYTIKLRVGEKILEKRVEVRLDPTLSVASADLQTQFELSLKLRDMQSAVNNALRALDSMKEQLHQIEKTVKDRMPESPKELTESIARYLTQVDEFSNKLASPRGGLGFRGRPMIADRLASLFSSVDGANAAPTSAMKGYFFEVEKEYGVRIEEYRKFLAENVAQMNETLRKHNAPKVVPGKP